MSGDPTYITSYNGARSLVMKVERDEIVEELLKAYIKNELQDDSDYADYGIGLRYEDCGSGGK